MAAVMEPAEVEASLDPQCPPNSEQTAPLSARSCVAEQVRSTRSGLQPVCVIAPKALQPNPWYTPTECRGGRGVQAEAIAQARAIAKLNAAGVHGEEGPPGGITPNLQWEVRYPGGRIDVLAYDRTDPDAPIELIELKGAWNGGVESAELQLGRYQTGLARHTTRPVGLFNFPSGHQDAFRILVQDCGDGARNRVINQYKVAATASPGVLLISGPARTVTSVRPPRGR
ncbi:MAG: hypothetical protein ACRDWY_16690 [Actinomycetes bacterium]